MERIAGSESDILSGVVISLVAKTLGVSLNVISRTYPSLENEGCRDLRD